MGLHDSLAYYIDRIEVQRVDAEPWEGWEVAPGKIAFQHVGYLPCQEKLAFASGVSATRFALIDADSGRSVATFPVKDRSNRRGRFQVLDFTSFSRVGRYIIRCGKLSTRAFPICDDFWHGTIERALNFYYGERCGFAVPGVHGVCHQDLLGAHAGVTKPINGGWHDASDMCQGSFRTGMVVYGMLQIYDQLRHINLRPDLQVRLLEEAKWGLDWLLKTRFGNGYRIVFAVMRIYTDNKVGTADDMVVNAQQVPFESFLFAAVASYASRVLKDVDPQRAALSLQAAMEDYEATLDQHPDWSGGTRDEVAFGALASAELYRVTGRRTFSDRAAQFGRLILNLQEQSFVDGIPVTGYFYTDASKREIIHDFHVSFENAPLIALRALAETFPAQDDWIKWYAAALLHSEYYLRQGASITGPYERLPSAVWRREEIERTAKIAAARRAMYPGVLPMETNLIKVREEILGQFNAGTHLSRDFRLRAFPIFLDRIFHGSTTINLSQTAALTAAAQLRNSPEAERLSRLQLQWTLGGNPFSQSLMYGEGYDFQPLEAYSSGNLVGALSVGMDSFHNDSPAWPTTNRPTSKEIWVLPVGYLLYDLAYAGLPGHVTVYAASGAEIRELRTGISRVVPAGSFSFALPAGNYSITYGKSTKRLAILGGGRYQLSLTPRQAIEMDLSASGSQSGTVGITARLRGAGAHKLELRAFNGAVDQPRSEINLTEGHERLVTWSLKIADSVKPWVVVVIPDGDMGGKKEVFGALQELRSI